MKGNPSNIGGKFVFKRHPLKFSHTQKIVGGFFLIILVGSFLLMLPVSARTRQWTPFADALFTATSATCVTGLTLFDTFTHWSLLGQILILIMIQLGGIGFMAVITMFSLMIKRKIGLHERQLMVQTLGMLYLSGAVRLIKRIIFGSLLIEGIGAVLLALRFIPKMGWGRGIYNAIFLSVSAFNNAGFDLMGRLEPFSSLTHFANDYMVLFVVGSLVFFGGLGFIIWDDILKHRFQLKKYELHTKIVLLTTLTLMVVGWLCFFLLESRECLEGMSLSKRLTQSLFFSVSLRTAGFVTFDAGKLSESGALLTLILMFIGASSGSTGGGIKVTTFAILVLSAVASMKQRKNIVIFKRQIDNETVKKASAMFIIYLAVVLIMTLVLTALEPFTLTEALFEVVSAVTTVGLSLGITPTHDLIGKLIMTFLMFIGRIGFITLIIALGGTHVEPPVERVTEKILIG